MNLKYYLRGLGIGMAVTAVLIAATSGKTEKLSDADIIKRAEALGMVDEHQVLLNNPVSDQNQSLSDNYNSTSENNSSDLEIPEPDSSEVTSDNEVSGKSVIFEIKSGMSSVAVSRGLVEAGLIEDAGQFDIFLCAGGYDKKLVAGAHAIPIGATKEEIASILISR